MNEQTLRATARALVGPDRGLLAMDESTGTCDKRFAGAGIPQTEEARRAYREMLITTPELGSCISGAILYDETIRQKTTGGVLFVKVLVDAGIVPGIKVDIGAKPLAGRPGERITEGLDGLRLRLQNYAEIGARFAEWRAVIAVGDGVPSLGCLEANAHALARYAALCQEAGLVPIVEPEVLMEGDHTQERCRTITEDLLRRVFDQIARQQVMLEGMILKPNMVLAGLTCATQESADEVADTTVRCLFSHGQFGRVLASRWIGVPAVEGQHLALGTASLSILGHEPTHPTVRVIALWNATPAETSPATRNRCDR